MVDPLAEMYSPSSPYTYVENNPIGFTDPTGMYKVDAKGDWVKVYVAGLKNREKMEIHYFRNNNTGQVFDVKTKYNYWHQKAFKKL